MKNKIELFNIENEHASDSLRFLNPKNKNILDLGCGRHTDRNGNWTLPSDEYTPIFCALREAKKIVGVDSRETEKVYYDEYFKNNFKNIETHFALLKRIAKKDQVEIFRVTSGDKKTQNAFNLLLKALYSINKSFFPKNRLNCKYCEYNNTKECP